MAAMRTWSICAVFTGLVLLLGGVVGCKGGSSGEAAKQSAEASKQLSGEEDALLERRDALLNSRRKLREKRQELVQERQRVLASGGDTSELDQKVAELSEEEEQLGQREDELAQDFENLLSQQRTLLASIASQGDDSAQVAAREAGIAGREKTLSSRESRLAEREAALAERERKLAVRERETCSVAAAPTIIQAPPPEGTTYRKKDVEPILKRARRHMSRQGILPSDLPGPVQGLEKDATRAMEKGEYGSAHFAASQLYATVKAMKIDKAFIQAKIGRLSAAMKGTTLDDKIQGKVDELFRQATSNYGDGKFSRANKQLNEIWALIRRG
jgi:hypothetical protein